MAGHPIVSHLLNWLVGGYQSVAEGLKSMRGRKGTSWWSVPLLGEYSFMGSSEWAGGTLHGKHV